MKTIAKKNPDGSLMLTRNGNPVICPFMAPTPIPQRGLQGTNLQMAFNPCTSGCAHFQVQEEVYLTCGGSSTYFTIEEPEQESKILRN
jgi:hypothetical protein